MNVTDQVLVDEASRLLREVGGEVLDKQYRDEGSAYTLAMLHGALLSGYATKAAKTEEEIDAIILATAKFDLALIGLWRIIYPREKV